ncbi:MAG: ARMT1-like domain-containing protein [Thermofilaceae archaeon]
MRIWPICVPCIYAARAREILNSELDPEEKIYALARLHELLEKVNSHSSTIRLANETFRLVKFLTYNKDPYLIFKRDSNELVKKILIPKLKDQIVSLESYELFKKLLIASINANSLDPGVPGYEALNVSFNIKIGLDESKEAYELVINSKHIVYTLDNSGEGLIDLEIIKLLSSIGLKVTVLAKSLPYQNDVTVEEAVALGFADYANVIGTGTDSAGPLPGEISDEALKALEKCDLVIAKGMAAFESFEEWRFDKPVLHIFRAKCLPVASTVGVSVGEGVIFIRR